jgi:hypothetical protein
MFAEQSGHRESGQDETPDAIGIVRTNAIKDGERFRACLDLMN